MITTEFVARAIEKHALEVYDNLFKYTPNISDFLSTLLNNSVMRL